MKCDFCGREFRLEEAVESCRGCPMHRNCGKSKCPSCGYETVHLPGWLRRLTRGGNSVSRHHAGPCTLATLAPGEKGTIAGLEQADQRTVRKLMAIGLTPGTEVRVVRTRPGVVLQVGFGELALDRETAGKVGITPTTVF